MGASDGKKPIHIEESPAKRFAREIREAEAAGTALDTLKLRLTLMDASKIKRDSTIALADVSFANGRMRYLGVRVSEGGVRSSELTSGGDDEPEAEAAPPAKPAKAKTTKPRKTATKAVKDASLEGA